MDPEKERITAYNFEEDDGADYDFDDKVKSCIYADLEIDFAGI